MHSYAFKNLPSRPEPSGRGYFRFAGTGDRDERDEDPDESRTSVSAAQDLDFRVELWAPDKAAVERVLAITANGSIGYAAYFESTKEYPDRYVTLRHKNRIMARWNPPLH